MTPTSAEYEAAVAELDALLDACSTDLARLVVLSDVVAAYEDAHVREPGES